MSPTSPTSDCCSHKKIWASCSFPSHQDSCRLKGGASWLHREFKAVAASRLDLTRPSTSKPLRSCYSIVTDHSACITSDRVRAARRCREFGRATCHRHGSVLVSPTRAGQPGIRVLHEFTSKGSHIDRPPVCRYTSVVPMHVINLHVCALLEADERIRS